MSSLYKKYVALIFVGVMVLYPLSAHAQSFADVVEQAGNCGVPQAAIQSLDEVVENGRVTEGQAASLLSPLLAACVEQLPVPPLADKLAEGLVKRVSPPQIVRALNRRLGGYRFARGLLLTRAGNLNLEALSVVGMGVDEGVARDDFSVFVREFGKESADMFLTGLTMVSLQGQIGFDAKLSRQIIRVGISSNGLDNGWRYFVRIILAAREHGVSDGTIADGALNVLSKGGVVSDVMEELGFTGRDLGGDEDNE